MAGMAAYVDTSACTTKHQQHLLPQASKVCLKKHAST
jgi:hypothetical protein